MHNENHGEQTRQTHGRRRYQCTFQTRKSDLGDVAKPNRRNAWERDAKEDARDGGKGARKIKWETHDPPCFETTLSQTKSLNVHASYTANPSCHRLANACRWPPSMHSEKTMGVGAMKRHNHGNVFGHCKLQQSIQLQRTFRNTKHQLHLCSLVTKREMLGRTPIAKRTSCMSINAKVTKMTIGDPHRLAQTSLGFHSKE